MSDRWQSCEDRILLLLADQAAFGLSIDEQEELGALLAVVPEFDQDCMERMAATVRLASVGKKLEPLPAAIQQRVCASARQSQIRSPRIG